MSFPVLLVMSIFIQILAFLFHFVSQYKIFQYSCLFKAICRLPDLLIWQTSIWCYYLLDFLTSCSNSDKTCSFLCVLTCTLSCSPSYFSYHSYNCMSNSRLLIARLFCMISFHIFSVRSDIVQDILSWSRSSFSSTVHNIGPEFVFFTHLLSASHTYMPTLLWLIILNYFFLILCRLTKLTVKARVCSLLILGTIILCLATLSPANWTKKHLSGSCLIFSQGVQLSPFIPA